MEPVTLGTNDFFGVPFPLVLADRFFCVYAEDGSFNLDVFRWDENKRQATYEVRAGRPLIDNISNNPTGIVTFAHPETSVFVYKFRPKPGVSQIFGKIPTEMDLEVRITDHSMTVVDPSAPDVPIVSLSRNQFAGMPIGVRIEADRTIGIAVNWLPDGMELARPAR